ncbi:MAG: Gfo/Idh/MocA family oxidoreductase, partial [Planctomycetales bacterium]|nr:Gfo/Idh/MocA family oxidoreductase [Planctomycetales bacterium]
GNRGFDNYLALADEEVVAVCDVDERYFRPVKDSRPDVATFADWRELLARDDLDLDGLVISTPDHTHAPIALAALRRGLHVYCEKPLAHSVAELRAMSAAASERPSLVTQMGNQHHASDGYRRAVEWIRSGRLGEVREVHVWSSRPIWPQGIDRPADTPPVPESLHWDLWLGPAPERPYHPVYHPMRWRGWWDFANGAIGDMGPHLIDAVQWGLNLPSPVRIEAESSPVNDETAPLWSIVRFDFEMPSTDSRDGEAAAAGSNPPSTVRELSLTWYDGGKQPPAEVTGVARPPAQGALVIGSDAKLFIPELGRQPIVVPRQKGERIEPPEPSLPRPASHMDEWLTACKQGRSTSSDFAYGRQLSELCLLGAIATRVGQPLTWSTTDGHFTNNPAANKLLKREYRDGWR